MPGLLDHRDGQQVYRKSLVVCRARGPGAKPRSRFLSQSGSSLPHSKPVLVFSVRWTLLPSVELQAIRQPRNLRTMATPC